MKPTWERDGVRLYLGDCLEILPHIGQVDAVVTDPPYSIPTQVAQGRTLTRNVGDLSIAETAFRVYFSSMAEQISETGRLFVFCDGHSYPVCYRAAYGRFLLASLIWNKNRPGMGREFRKQHEMIIHGWKPETPVVESFGTAYPDVIDCLPVPSHERFHPAEKPIGLILELLRVCGETIADPFMGSGTTGVAAVREGRRFVGIEIDEEHFDNAVRRIEAELNADRDRLFPVRSVETQAELFAGE